MVYVCVRARVWCLFMYSTIMIRFFEQFCRKSVGGVREISRDEGINHVLHIKIVDHRVYFAAADDGDDGNTIDEDAASAVATFVPFWLYPPLIFHIYYNSFPDLSHCERILPYGLKTKNKTA